MIEAKHLNKSNCFMPLKCDSCNRAMPFIIEYKIKADKSNDCETTNLCEDCSNALTNLFHSVMEEGKPHKYENDEIKEMEEK